MPLIARWILLLLTVLYLPGCTAMLLGGNSSTEPPSSGTGTVSAADSAISGDIRRQYSADAELRVYTIGIRTVSGNVVLTGTVGSYPVRDKAVRIARATDGVRSVDNRIAVNTNL